jgi:Transposase DDE domain
MAAAVMFWARMRSLNALEMSGQSHFWKHWLNAPMPSADTMGEVHSKMDANTLRDAIHQAYGQLKRNKALPDDRGISFAIVDGHESHTSYLQHCSGCLARTVHFDSGDRTQYYHRQVTLMLVTGAPASREPLRILLDHEPQLPGEDEIATAERLLKRVIDRYPRAFDLVLMDGLYARANFFNFLLDRNKHALAVLKDERRNLYQDVAGMFTFVPPVEGTYRSRTCLWWDFPDLLSWPEVKAPVRVIRSLETRSVKRQLDKKRETLTSDWMWVTTLPSKQVPVGRCVELGHQRWDIENHGFNELVNGWNADHIMKHDPNAIECFLLLTFLTHIMYHAFIYLNLKPSLRVGKSKEYWAKLMAAEIYANLTPWRKSLERIAAMSP